MLRPFAPPPGTRFPRDGDRAIAFEAAGPLRGRITWAEVLDYHDPPAGRFTLLREVGGRVAGAACFELRLEDVLLDYITRNDRFDQGGVSVGVVLVGAVEDFARFHRRAAVRLESMEDGPLTAWYEGHGFVREGPPLDDPRWGRLFPMMKPVSGRVLRGSEPSAPNSGRRTR